MTSHNHAVLPSLGSLTDPAAHRQPVDLHSADDDRVGRWLQSMLLIRRAEEAIGTMVESGEAQCPCHLGIGQEAVAVGLADNLRPTDACFGAHRSHSHFLALGGDVNELMAEVLGKVTGCSRGFGGSMHLRAPHVGLLGTVPIVGATIPIAAGAALSAKLAGQGDIAVSFLGDGATEEGVFHETLNIASLMQLPVLFVVENNLYSSHLHISDRQPNDRVARFAEAHCVPVDVIDGNDIVVVAETTKRLIDDMRGGGGPRLLEAVTYRWRGHVGHREDEDVGVERSDNLTQWKQRDPIRRLSDAWPESGQAVAAIEERVDRLVNEALEFARRSPFPADEELLSAVFSGGRS